jgi:hypothetical protein
MVNKGETPALKERWVVTNYLPLFLFPPRDLSLRWRSHRLKAGKFTIHLKMEV